MKLPNLTLPHIAVLQAALITLPLAVSAQDRPIQPAAPAPAAAAVPPAPAKNTAKAVPGGIVLNFQGASLTDVLNYLSEAAGFVIVQETPVSGTVNVVSRQAVNAEEAVDLLNAVLSEKGYTAIRNGRILKIVSRKDVQKRELPVEMGSDPDKIPRKDEVVTQILPLRFGEAAKLIENLRPLLPDNATISANEASNAILMTDTQTNIRRIAQIIRALDTSVASISSIHVFPLHFADAKAVADVLTQLFATNSTGRTSSQGGRGGRGGFGFGGGGPGGGFGGPGGPGGGQPAAPQSEARQAVSRVVAVADEQSNSVIVTAPDELLPTIEDIVNKIDTNITDVTEMRIFRLLHADAVELAEVINNVYSDTAGQSNQSRSNQNNRGGRGGGNSGGQGGFGFPGQGGGQSAQTGQQSERALLQTRVSAVGDPRTNSLVVNAARESMTQIAEMVGRLDSTDAKKQRVFTYSLQHADAENVANILRGMLGQQTSSTSQSGTSRLTERTSTGATMDSSQGLSGSSGGAGGGRSTR